MARRSGRPRANLEKTILEEMAARNKELEAIISRKINFNTPGSMVFEAARLLLEYRADPRKIELTPIYHTINHYAQKHGPHGRWRNVCDFLKAFIQHHAPHWNWQAEAVQGDIERRNYKRENERIAKEHAKDARWRIACANKFYTPDAPNEMLLQFLAWEWRTKRIKNPHARYWWENYKRWRVIRTTAPTLRELKLATAIPESTITKIIKTLRPKKSEIIRQALRHKFSGRGAVPRRYGPRLVIGVLNECVNRLPEFPIDDGERKRLRKTALLVKRAFAARLNPSRRST